jgi:capsular exopolysaccharide synthesis family protein
MTLREYALTIRAGWRIVALVTVLFAALGTITVLLTPTYYSASVTFYISTQSASTSSSDAYQGSLLSQERVKSYTELLSSVRLGQEIVEESKLDDNPVTVADSISAAVTPDTVLLTADVEDKSPERALAIAGALGSRFPQLVAVLERPSNPALPPAVVAQVVQGPILAPEPVSPKPLLYMTLAVVAGVIVGIFVVIVRRALDRTIRTKDELSLIFPKPLLGVVGEDGELQSSPLAMRDRPQSDFAENLRTVRANFNLLSFADQTKCYVVTSSIEGEGKSTILSNLAMAEAASGNRVLVLEADLRKPRVSEYLGASSEVGLTQVLTRRIRLQDCVQRGPVPHVDVLSSGPVPPNPYEMVESAAMQELVEKARRDYAVVLVDAPPLLPVADGIALAKATDGLIFVTRAAYVYSASVRRAYEILDTAGVTNIGVVFNRAERVASGYYGSYHSAFEGRASSIQSTTSAQSEEDGTTIRLSPSPRPRNGDVPRSSGGTGGGSGAGGWRGTGGGLR